MASLMKKWLFNLIQLLIHFGLLSIGCHLFYLSFAAIYYLRPLYEHFIDQPVYVYLCSDWWLYIRFYAIAIVVIALLGICVLWFELGVMDLPSVIKYVYVLIIVALIGVNIGFLVKSGDYRREVDNQLQSEISNYTHGEHTQEIHLLLGVFQCCGWKGPQDFSFDMNDLPVSCCLNNIYDKNVWCKSKCQQKNIRFPDGCQNSPVMEFFDSRVKVCIYALFLVALAILFCSGFKSYLTSRVDDPNDSPSSGINLHRLSSDTILSQLANQ